MRKLLFIFILALNTNLASAAPTADASVYSLIDAFKDNKRAEYHNISSLLLTAAKAVIKDNGNDLIAALKSINSVQILNLDNCSGCTKRRFLSHARRVYDRNSRELIRKNKKKSFSSIQLKMDNGVVRELAIIEADGSDYSVILIKGRIPLNKLSDIINNKSKLKTE